MDSWLPGAGIAGGCYILVYSRLSGTVWVVATPQPDLPRRPPAPGPPGYTTWVHHLCTTRARYYPGYTTWATRARYTPWVHHSWATRARTTLSYVLPCLYPGPGYPALYTTLPVPGPGLPCLCTTLLYVDARGSPRACRRLPRDAGSITTQLDTASGYHACQYSCSWASWLPWASPGFPGLVNPAQCTTPAPRKLPRLPIKEVPRLRETPRDHARLDTALRATMPVSQPCSWTLLSRDSVRKCGKWRFCSRARRRPRTESGPGSPKGGHLSLRIG